MIKNVLLNVLYNIGILILGLAVFYGFKGEQYPLAIASLFGLALVVYLKYRLIKEVRTTAKKRP
ncbi:DUF6358 family protein [Pedobacter sp. SYSU D00535]|uniref:DUF6358 family protein n=1 Tax=Pedobacter sp. SYSU D00535 TaxID=2810308 RepID=UPI001A976A52|nr:DUF6358 family protein [Pedobacter sp. SYSU D00535]